MARSVLLEHAPGTHVHTDILTLLSPAMRSKVSVTATENLRRVILDPRVHLDLHQPLLGAYAFGDCHVAGPPCVDVFPRGAGRPEQGPSMACLYVWAGAIRDSSPMLVIVENVPRFPVALLVSLFGDLYAIDWVILDAKDIGAPARRRRLYVVVTLRGKLRLTRPLADLVDVIKRIYPVTRTWESLFCLGGDDDCVS